MNIVFECVGFATNPVFVEASGRYTRIGFVRTHGLEPEVCRDVNTTSPTDQHILMEYARQLREKGVFINNDIKRAG